ncbi:hypothetical protein [Methanococcoides sp.]|jgi:hypothetical protein|uniref:hypothetical protein n=1 Tax=Methanococcoides sp. TaxID=1966350 RepID=UPI00272DF614|nr:hypothetical protein [Methanococcoides sp.]
MRKISSILVALAVCVALVGVAAAESPDAGSTWSTAKSFTMNNGYNFVSGQLTESPVDNIDVWKSTTPDAGDYLEMFLDSTSYNNNVKAELFDNDKDLMQRLEKNNNAAYDYSLDSSPAYVKITGDLEDRAYTFTVYRN